ncbi:MULTISPECIES: 16S rRNA (cytosine(967)-C(5))-methyltransferase RsmB [unclassified Enterococcus]|uniref:16S rRNA (cytosine(967)-C(5))-methyltransferase RsmB n=1 Tax=unclassified Enterococcus TaxID=2608891 RepID=UPI001557CB5B|nr:MULTISPECIES: 16S rRNA (cytosine(967)-C(5))-methyltransferase RsmB [unclassified Enterococcus]MBS7576859.1 16S rRNA (cytosine(967)-C(5))-methyltransferase RsmB [Enterococcus sp. MMGLQ5-2]MBS7584266.1 16S rRNA (cytosine(967)-C(5))-methyltransferase RsmB [Enterococcus sp. MMGLQ5-1]NPD12122.1 16S rRNA (cytosine(967)-C(5))-methyltransferase RsmB [Enterococcus sp. MMGLQ5-1]NPD36694.1 16S rRNA (cytosine(967)-C(5))-methyltransferase RsmB [Enterococcus sp. MMGLQ5-2]
MASKKIPAWLKVNPRFLALQALNKILSGEAYSNLLLGDMLKSTSLSDRDRALFTEMVYGTVARKLTLKYFLNTAIKNPKRLDDWVANLLMLSVYQMQYLDKVPNHAILNDAVEIAKNFGNPGIGKFVNGVLRNLTRNGVPNILAIDNPIERYSIQYSVPEWLVEKLIQQYGDERALQIFDSLFVKNKASIRVNTAKTSVAKLEQQLNALDFAVSKSQLSPVGLIAKRGFFAGNELFDTGEYTIQDESSQLVAPLLEVQPNDKILDACAAPGGKTTHLATYLTTGKITALDLYDHKLKLINDNAKRLGVDRYIVTQKLDATQVAQHFPKESFDRILVDAPCSGIGLIRRKPDIKYRKMAADFTALQKIQLAILDSCAQVLKKSGIMVYSTCTIIAEENQEVIERFLASHADFVIEKIETSVGLTEDGQLLLTPELYNTDGFFICKLRKRS